MRQQNSQQLDYAPKTQQKARRRIAFAIIAIVLIVGLWRWGPHSWRHAQTLYFQNQCIKHQAPPDQAVLSWDGANWKSRAGPVALDRYYALASPPGRQPHPIVFLHERQVAGRASRLIVVQTYNLPAHDGPRQWFAIESIGLMGFLSQKSDLRTDAMEALRGAKTFTVFPGQIDESDSSHFTIKVISDGNERIFDGWLTASDDVVIELRGK